MSETKLEKERRRVEACIKACEGIPTDLLEEGFFARLLAACLSVRDPRVTELLQLLKASVVARGRWKATRSVELASNPPFRKDERHGSYDSP